MKQISVILILVVTALISGCATLSGNADGPSVRVIGIDPLPSEGLEARFALKLRVQNPNESALSYDGLSVSLDLDGKGLASGVSDITGEIPRFSEEVLTVPVSISAFSVFRQLLALAEDAKGAGNALNRPIAYKLRGKLGAGKGTFGATRFTDSGVLDFLASEKTEQ